MVQAVTAILPTINGQINLDLWLATIERDYPAKGAEIIRQAISFAQINGEDINTDFNESCLEEGIEIANVLLNIKSDYESIAAAIIYPTLRYTDLTEEDITEHFDKRIGKLVAGVEKLGEMGRLGNTSSSLIDNLRQMLLTMVDDVRVVLIKLAERCFVMRNLDDISSYEQQQAAKQTMHIYAPLANRLGISEIKWELEDLSFRYAEPDTYRKLAKQLNTRRIDREHYIQEFMSTLSSKLNADDIKHEISGRAKHIFSIYKKMQRKDVPFEEVYDAFALRVLVQDVEECYKVLSMVHSSWDHVPEEFDDYVTTPKPNGYQSIHTVAIGPDKKNIEIQIRTHDMHEKNEMGVAAHWMYKEGGKSKAGFEDKVAWLRQLLDWQQELVEQEELPEALMQGVTEDRVYVFTPGGDVISLSQGATALDFAYHIHSDVGHRCKGAKTNGKIITLTEPLKTGDKVEVITGKESKPSRDWLNPNSGYLKTPRARAKVHSWFKKQDFDHNKVEGEAILDRELKSHDWKNVNLEDVAKSFRLKNRDELTAALGNGDVRIPQLQQAVMRQLKIDTDATQTIDELPKLKAIKSQSKSGVIVEGVGDLLTHIAGCCKPLPGDTIVGYVTQGHGVTIHRDDCPTILKTQAESPERVLDVSWGQASVKGHTIDVIIEALDTTSLLRDVTAIMSQEKINIADLKLSRNHKNQTGKIYLRLEISNIEQWDKLLKQLQQVPNVYEVYRA